MCKIHFLQRKQHLPIEQDLAWAFLSNPANLLEISPPWMQMSDETFTPAKTVYPGMLILLRMKLPGGFPSRVVTQITHIDAPNYFIDEQKKGPFAFFHHQHSLTPIENGVELTDTLHYALPFGFLGDLANSLMVRRELERM